MLVAESPSTANEIFQSLQLDLSAVSSISIDPSPIVRKAAENKHHDQNSDWKDIYSHQTVTNDNAISTNTQYPRPSNPQTGLSRHLSLSFSRKNRSSAESISSAEIVARREELRRRRIERIRSEILSDSHLDGNESYCSSMNSSHPSAPSTAASRSSPREGIEFSIRTHAQQRLGPESGDKQAKILPEVIGICPNDILRDANIRAQEPRRNSCPSQFATPLVIPPRRNSQDSVQSIQFGYYDCDPLARVARQSKDTDMAPSVSQRMPYNRNMRNSSVNGRILRTNSIPVRWCSSRNYIGTSISDMEINPEALSTLQVSKRDISVTGQDEPQTGTELPYSENDYFNEKSTISCNDNTTWLDESVSSFYGSSADDSPSTHTASKVDIRELIVSRSSIIRLELPRCMFILPQVFINFDALNNADGKNRVEFIADESTVFRQFV